MCFISRKEDTTKMYGTSSMEKILKALTKVKVKVTIMYLETTGINFQFHVLNKSTTEK